MSRPKASLPHSITTSAYFAVAITVVVLIGLGVGLNQLIRRISAGSGLTNWPLDTYVLLVVIYADIVVYRLLHLWVSRESPSLHGPLPPLTVFILLSALSTSMLALFLPQFVPSVSAESSVVLGFCFQAISITCAVTRSRAEQVSEQLVARIAIDAGLTVVGAAIVWFHQSSFNLAIVLPAIFLLGRRMRWMKLHLKRV